MAELLFEVFCEEIPARMQSGAALRWKLLAEKKLQEKELAFERVETFITPRRLTLRVQGLPLQQPTRQEVRKGPRVDAPPEAIEGFFRSVGKRPEDCTQETFGKQTCWVASLTLPGKPTVELIPDICREMLEMFAWPKSMRWGTSQQSWVRPIRNLLCVFDQKPVAWAFDPEGEVLHANNQTYGHRFLSPEPFAVTDFKSYENGLQKAFVMLDATERRQRILQGLEHLAKELGLALLLEDLEPGGLLDEVTGLVEWPVVLKGRIREGFMGLPPEVLITPMRAHQRYFAFKDPSTGRLAPFFGIVANTQAKDGNIKIISGNERVLEARLSDAQFFWTQDLKNPLTVYQQRLETRQFFAGLGTLYDKTLRLEKLAAKLAPGNENLKQAAFLCKADLTTQMVGEFPELQGVMGMYYALEQGVKPEIAQAIQVHYWPQGKAQIPPEMSHLAMELGMLDRLDTLVGFFKIDQIPTGSKDPLALRRAASGLLQLILAYPKPFPLKALVHEAYGLYSLHSSFAAESAELPLPDLLEKLTAFLEDRLRHLLKEQNISHDLIEAVLKPQRGFLDALKTCHEKIVYLSSFLKTDQGIQLVAAFKRALSMVQTEEAKHRTAYTSNLFQEASLLDAAEKELWHAVSQVQDVCAQSEWRVQLQAVQSLVAPIQKFFEHVVVNASDPALRQNRLALLVMVRELIQPLADFSTLEG
ncbi:MAG: glycine--tRNA ligase subunit beta [Alphaproteobacteria bacterium]